MQEIKFTPGGFIDNNGERQEEPDCLHTDEAYLNDFLQDEARDHDAGTLINMFEKRCWDPHMVHAETWKVIETAIGEMETELPKLRALFEVVRNPANWRVM